MQTRFVHYSLLTLFIIISNAAPAQQKANTKKNHGQYSFSNTGDGKTKESVNTWFDDKNYKMETVNDKITAFYVNDEKIPESRYSEYAAVISKIKEQIKIDKKQALEDQQQAKRDQKQAAKDQRQAKLDQEQSIKDQELYEEDSRQARKDKEAAEEDQARAMKDKQQVEEDSREAMKDKERAEDDYKQAKKDQAQAKLDQEQAKKDQQQAKLDQEQAEEDQRVLKNLISDLIKDGIINDEKSVHTLSLSPEGMTVNEKTQPTEVNTRYKEKYKRFSTGNFYYQVSKNGNKSIQMHRPAN